MTSASESEPRPPLSEQELEALVQNYIAGKTQAAEAAGQSPAEIAQGMHTASFILWVKMLKNYVGEIWPTGQSLLQDAAVVLSASEAEVRELCERFVQSGWLESDYRLTPLGRQLSGYEQSET